MSTLKIRNGTTLRDERIALEKHYQIFIS